MFVLFVSGCSAWEEKDEKDVKGITKIAFWDEQRKGTNFLNSTSLPDNYEAAKEFNIEYIRLAPDKWAKDRDFLFNDQADANPNKDFLIGNADQYEGIVEEDFTKLKADLDAAYERGSKVVLTVLSLPGNRWRQFNDYKNDDRIWQDFSYHEQSAQFWKDLASRLKDHPAIIGYNLINEPHPETATGFNDFWTEDYHAWYSKVENTAADLNKLYETIVQSIRTVDSEAPIILNSGLYSTPWAFQYLKPMKDDKVLYAFHMYEPYEMTSQNRRKGFTYEYPGKVKVGEEQTEKMFNKEALQQFLEPIEKWAEEHNIPANRIIAEEFGINRMVKGSDQYLSDLISIFDEYGWHWAFYAFREDTWEGMDYELGDQPPKWKYWEALENGKRPNREDIQVDNQIWNTLKQELKK
ncbi:glycoside hydrolase family 5 protein [Peribacillus butanolivorans]|uniref:glycoside hydrolase family 5 protein n=1 Tax=Peribacillus butanolivorans TaxID=421767 RepID=UPI0036DC2713